MVQKSDLPNHLLDGAKTRTVNIGISTTCPSTGERHAGVVNLGSRGWYFDMCDRV